MGTGTPKEPMAPPVPGTAPLTLAKQETTTSIEPQKLSGPALRRLFLNSRKTQTRTRQEGPTLLQLTYIQIQLIHPHNARARIPVESRCPGEPTRRGLGRSSPVWVGPVHIKQPMKRKQSQLQLDSYRAREREKKKKIESERESKRVKRESERVRESERDRDRQRRRENREVEREGNKRGGTREITQQPSSVNPEADMKLMRIRNVSEYRQAFIRYLSAKIMWSESQNPTKRVFPSLAHALRAL